MSQDDVRELLPGLYGWSTMYDKIGSRVHSHLVASAGVVIDPRVPAGGFEAVPERPQQVVLTSGNHLRDAVEFANHFDGIPIRALRAADDRLGGSPELATFGGGDEVAPGVTAIDVGVLSADETALHLTEVEGGAIALADGLVRFGGRLTYVPDGLMGDDPEGVKAGLTEKLRALLERDFDTLLFAHGDPIVGGAKAELRAFVEAQG